MIESSESEQQVVSTAPKLLKSSFRPTLDGALSSERLVRSSAQLRRTKTCRRK